MRLRYRFFMLFFFIACGVLFYIWHEEQQANKVLLEKIKTELASDRQLADELCQPGACFDSSSWHEIESKTRNAVVQIFSYKAQFDWFEPYKTPQQGQSRGSGFFIDDQGHIITNAHVVNQAVAVFLQIPVLGKRRFAVDVLGISPERDLALLKLKEDSYNALKKELGSISFLKLGNSDTVKRAEELMALGYPLGQEGLKSATGVVSGHENLGGKHMIQISTPINPGNSGGPSLRCDGTVVGVNTAAVHTGGTQNVGYIITSNEVKLFLKHLDIMPAADKIKLVRKPFLGVLFNSATDDLTEYLGNPLPGGPYVVQVFKGAPLYTAGVKPGDMIYEINGHRLDNYGDITVRWSEDKVSVFDYTSRLLPGETLHIVVYRNGKRKEIVATLDDSVLAPIRMRYPSYEKIDYEVIAGVVVMPLNLNILPPLMKAMPELSRYADSRYQIDPVLIITHMFPNSALSRARILGPGNVIKEVNGVAVKTLQDFRKAMKKSLNTGYVTIKSEEDVLVVLPLREVIEDEPRLAMLYHYAMTPLAQELSQAYTKA